MKVSGFPAKRPSYWRTGKKQTGRTVPKSRGCKYVFGPGPALELNLQRGDSVAIQQSRNRGAQITTEVITDLGGDPINVSVVIPCLNEAKSLGICVEKALKAFQDANLRGEV